MDEQLLQRTRYQLQTRFRRARVTEMGNFYIVCLQLLTWLENHPILGSILHRLGAVEGNHFQEIAWINELQDNQLGTYYFVAIAKRPNENVPLFRGNTATTYEQHVSACLQIIRTAITRPNQRFYSVFATYLTGELFGIQGKKESDSLSIIQNIALRDLYEYMDEHLDGINAVNGLMNKYKQLAEWFEAENLRGIVEASDSRQTERSLAVHLQKYIFNQGVEFMIEPVSASGEADLVLRDASGKYIIIDAKYIKEDSNRSTIVKKIAEGFNQVARYCHDFNQQEGFLAIYVNDNISIDVELQIANGFSFCKVGSKVIYYVEINIADRPTASKSGKPKPIIITNDEIMHEITD